MALNWRCRGGFPCDQVFRDADYFCSRRFLHRIQQQIRADSSHLMTGNCNGCQAEWGGINARRETRR